MELSHFLGQVTYYLFHDKVSRLLILHCCNYLANDVTDSHGNNAMYYVHNGHTVHYGHNTMFDTESNSILSLK